MKIWVCGLSHSTAPIEVRERLAFSPYQAKEALTKLPAGIRNGVILSTCNRTEVYGVSENARSARRQVIAFLSRCREVEASFFSPYLYIYEQADAMRHLFRVASGIDSLVLGEDQVQGQVRQALHLALEADTAGRSLAFLFRRAVEVGKRARSETLIGRYAVSVSRASILLAKELLGELKEHTTLVISAGETGELTSKIARECGAGRLLVTNRTLGRAKTLANRLGGKAIPFRDLGIALAQADIVISSTSAPGLILGPEIVAGAMSQRDGRPLLLIDLAIPRDIDPKVKEMANVFLYNIDDLQLVSQAGLEERQKEAVRVEAIIAEEVERAMKWWRLEEVVPTITALQYKAEAVRRREVARSLKKLTPLSPQAEAQIDVLTKAIVRKLLHHPLSHLKQDGHSLSFFQDFFDLDQTDQKS